MSDLHDELIYTSENTTPEQQTLLNRDNPHQYSVSQELSSGKDTKITENGEKKSDVSAESGENEREKSNCKTINVRTKLLINGSGKAAKESAKDRKLRDAVVDLLRKAGIEVVTDSEEGQRVLDMENDRGVTLNKAQKRTLETARLNQQEEGTKGTVVSSDDGAKILNNLDILAESLEKITNRSKTFIGDVAKALGAKQFGSKSQYATFETKNGQIVTIRLGNQNVTVSSFDNNGEDNGISIVDSGKGVSYSLKKGDVTYTATTEINGKGEQFTNFFTDKKPTIAEQGTSNTDDQHVQPQMSAHNSSAKLQKVSEIDEESTKIIFENCLETIWNNI